VKATQVPVDNVSVCEEAAQISRDYLSTIIRNPRNAATERMAERQARARLRRLASAPVDPQLRRVLRDVATAGDSASAARPGPISASAAAEANQESAEYLKACQPYWGRVTSPADVQTAPDEILTLHVYRGGSNGDGHLTVRWVAIDDPVETATVELTDHGVNVSLHARLHRGDLAQVGRFTVRMKGFGDDGPDGGWMVVGLLQPEERPSEVRR
jgi:hypothetical protein